MELVVPIEDEDFYSALAAEARKLGGGSMSDEDPRVCLHREGGIAIRSKNANKFDALVRMYNYMKEAQKYA